MAFLGKVPFLSNHMFQTDWLRVLTYSKCFKDIGTLDSSKNYPRVEPQTIRRNGPKSIDDFTTMLEEAKLERL